MSAALERSASLDERPSALRSASLEERPDGLETRDILPKAQRSLSETLVKRQRSLSAALFFCEALDSFKVLFCYFYVQFPVPGAIELAKKDPLPGT